MGIHESTILHVKLYGDAHLKLANALEAYPEAVTIRVDCDLARYGCRAPRVIGTIYDGNPYSERDDYEDRTYVDELEFTGWVHIDYLQAGLHLEQAPDEWTQLECPYSYGPVLWRAVNHIPEFDTEARSRYTATCIANLLQRA